MPDDSGFHCPGQVVMVFSPDGTKVVDQARSKRSRFMTLSHAATKSRTNFSFESSHA